MNRIHIPPTVGRDRYFVPLSVHWPCRAWGMQYLGDALGVPGCQPQPLATPKYPLSPAYLAAGRSAHARLNGPCLGSPERRGVEGETQPVDLRYSRRQTSIKGWLDASATLQAPLCQWQGPQGHAQGSHILPPNLIMEGGVFLSRDLAPPICLPTVTCTYMAVLF